MTTLTAKGSLAARVLAALGASVCRVAPLLLKLGIGGAWIGTLTAFANGRSRRSENDLRALLDHGQESAGRGTRRRFDNDRLRQENGHR